jgi:hypothetical protein
LNVLLANLAPARSMRRRQPSFREDHTNSDTLTVPVRNYVSGNLGNYVSDNPLNLGKSVSADKDIHREEPQS